MSIHFIKAVTSRDPSLDQIKEKYDFVINEKLFDKTEKNKVQGYQLLYSYITKHLKNNNDKIITLGNNNSISLATVLAINQKYNNLAVLWINLKLCIDILSEKPDDFTVASVLGFSNEKLLKENININPEQMIFYGTNDNESELDTMYNYNVPIFTNKKINDVGYFENIIKSMVADRPLHISLDMAVFDKLKESGLKKLLFDIKDNIVSMDISNVGVYSSIVRDILKETFDIKEKCINIFTEDSQFLIFRPFDQEIDESEDKDANIDIGWYILRGLDTKTKDELLTIIPNDTITTIDIDDDTYMVTKTTINEQNSISYYTANSANDAALFPQEKALMTFELLNNSK